MCSASVPERREEVIIAQAGNSGGTSNNITFSISELMGIMAFVIVMILILLVIFRLCRKRLEKKIRAELRRSQEIIS